MSSHHAPSLFAAATSLGDSELSATRHRYAVSTLPVMSAPLQSISVSHSCLSLSVRHCLSCNISHPTPSTGCCASPLAQRTDPATDDCRSARHSFNGQSRTRAQPYAITHESSDPPRTMSSAIDDAAGSAQEAASGNLLNVSSTTNGDKTSEDEEN